ncbi:uncharacterized protein KIAA1257 homolog isoform X2 [Tyto alba]|uniref:uncharacterized protein KIAA1257 homolog isoform X2 n=1 Tax=Tyto alba TaxID=56313 RepID=UPI001C6685C0|nr:uncharacterized protein KIAA1257 homolog isoform X2 [Tyto alba]
MAEHKQNSKAVEEEEVEEHDKEMTDLNTICSESSFETENLEVLGSGGCLTPEGESSRLLPSEESSVEPDGSHTVTCTLTVSLAVPALPTGQNREKSNPPGTQGKRIQVEELGSIPRMRRCYHIEYFLLPDDLVPRKLDLVLFGVVAKLFTESSSEAITPWFENDKMWISWNHSVVVDVTNEYVIKLRDHKIILKIWDTKDKVSSKVGRGKPKPTSSLEGDTEDVGGVKHTVLLQRKFFEESQPAPSRTRIKAVKKPKAQEKSSALPAEEETDLNELATSNSGLTHPSRRDDLSTVRNVKFAKSSFLDKAQHLKQKAVAVSPVSSTSKETEKANNVRILTYRADKTGTTSGRRGSGPKRNSDAAVAKSYGMASLQLDVMPLLSGEKSVISRLAENNPKVLDAYVTFTVETPLLSERQKHELNPLIIKINSATCLPNTPVPIEMLQRLCVPTYCKYKFHNFPPHRTHGQVHGTHVYFKDVNVLLTGTMKPGELQSYLRGPPLEIEVHDRDRNMENTTEKPCLFGEDEADEKVGKVSFLACKSTIYNSATRNKVWHPHGVAKVSLTDLLVGRKYLTISAPIHSCSAPNTAAFSEEDKKKEMTKSVSSSSLLPMGHYLESDSLLKVRVEIAVPLGMHAETADAQVTNCPYGYIIYIFDYNNSSLLHDLVEEITEINAKALQLDCYPVHLVGMALAALKLKTTLRKVSELDVVTGFHLLDGATHLFVLEGLKDKAIKRLWDRHFERTYRHEDGQLEILYNSQLSFHQRLYTDLEAIFYNFRLCQPLCTITKQSLLYVRGVVPWACFQALSRLSSLCHSKRLRDVIHGDLLPSAEMITVLSHEYGVPLADEDLFTQNPPFLSFSSDDYTVPGKVSRVKQAACSSLDNYKEVHVQRKKEIADKMSFERNHTKANVGAVCQLKGKMKEPKFETFRISPADGKSVFNYSSQSLNSAELAKQHLRQEMAKDPKNRFTYCHEHLSATFDPVDVAAACKEFFAKSKSMWLSPDGFVFPGFKSSLESNRHPQMPDEARLEELSEKWQENVLHANTEPVLSRERWSWDKRHIDFDLYKKPPELFTTPAPQTVCCQPCEDATQILQTRFDDAKLKAHCSTAAGLPTGGPSARFRLQKLQGLLKDEHRKFPLRKAGPVLKAKGNFSRAGRARGHGLFSCPSPGSVGRAPWGFGALLGGRRSVTSSFGPGPDHQHSLRRSRNVAPGTTDSMRRLKKNLQGADFKYDNLTARSSKSEPASFYTVRAKGL